MGSLLLLGCSGLMACSPSTTAAKPPARTITNTNPSPQPIIAVAPELPKQRPAVVDAPIELTVDALPFDARANPFAPPEAELEALSTATTGPRKADLKLVGLLGDSAKSSAVIELDGKQHVVSAGAKFASPNGLNDLNVLEIRQADIVVEQGGRRWIVPLPTP